MVGLAGFLGVLGWGLSSHCTCAAAARLSVVDGNHTALGRTLPSLPAHTRFRGEILEIQQRLLMAVGILQLLLLGIPKRISLCLCVCLSFSLILS